MIFSRIYFLISMLTTYDYVVAEVRIESKLMGVFFDAGRADMRAAGSRTWRYFHATSCVFSVWKICNLFQKAGDCSRRAGGGRTTYLYIQHLNSTIYICLPPSTRPGCHRHRPRTAQLGMGTARKHLTFSTDMHHRHQADALTF